MTLWRDICNGVRRLFGKSQPTQPITFDRPLFPKRVVKVKPHRPKSQQNLIDQIGKRYLGVPKIQAPEGYFFKSDHQSYVRLYKARAKGPNE